MNYKSELMLLVYATNLRKKNNTNMKKPSIKSICAKFFKKNKEYET